MSWLDNYVEYAKNNEATERLHWWTAVTILGAALRRNVSFSKGYYKVFPSMWTMVIAPSGTKKTTAIQIGYNLLSKLEHVRLLPDKGSPEGIALSLSEPELEGGEIESQGIIYAPELSNFMDKRHHNEGLVSFLLRLSDCPDTWKYRTRQGGFISLRNVAVTFLAATADDLLYEAIPPLALKSGFLARFVCITSSTADTFVPFPWKDPKLESDVLNELYELSLLKGDMVLNQKAQEWYIAWYFRHKAQISATAGTKLRAYFERKPDHLLRTAMLTSIARLKRLEYTVETFEEALKRLDEAEQGLPSIYSEIDASATGKDQTTILRQIDAAGGELFHDKIVQLNLKTMDITNLKKLMQGLIEGKYIKPERLKDGTIIYRRIKGGKMGSAG